MLGIVPRPVHGVIYYLWSTAFSSAPEWFSFADDARARLFCRAMGGGAMTMSLFTRYEMGVVPVLPFNMHLIGDVLSVVAGFAGLALTRNSKTRGVVLGFTVFEIVALIMSKRDPQ